MDVTDFDYDLPDELIAQEPAERGHSRLLLLDRDSGAVEHSTIARLPEHLGAGDLVVVNDTRVFPARLLGRRVPSGGAVECLLLSRGDAGTWSALVHPGQKLRPGARILFERDGTRLQGEILARHFHGRRTIRLWSDEGDDIDDAIDRIGHVPLPPYIVRADRPSDRQRYQTVYARVRGSVAAPTAGLHLTEHLLETMRAGGVGTTAITLHVGYGTFKPVRAARVEDHQVDPEVFEVHDTAARTIADTRRAGHRVIAVGTTTTRALESLSLDENGIGAPSCGETRLFIHPGHHFRIVQGLLTNFHLPRSSLLMLVAAFAGRERVLAAYREAIREGYRFYSYGDAMLIL